VNSSDPTIVAEPRQFAIDGNVRQQILRSDPGTEPGTAVEMIERRINCLRDVAGLTGGDNVLAC
jgi:hypothetical protein